MSERAGGRQFLVYVAFIKDKLNVLQLLLSSGLGSGHLCLLWGTYEGCNHVSILTTAVVFMVSLHTVMHKPDRILPKSHIWKPHVFRSWVYQSNGQNLLRATIYTKRAPPDQPGGLSIIYNYQACLLTWTPLPYSRHQEKILLAKEKGEAAGDRTVLHEPFDAPSKSSC